MKGRTGFLFIIYILITCFYLLQGCGRNKEGMQSYVDNYLQIVKDLKNQTRVSIIKNGAEAIITYRKSGFTDIDNAERAKNLLLEGISLDSISLGHITSLKNPDQKAEEITKELARGVLSTINGNIIFASNYSKAKDQNIEERKATILNIRPGMRYLAEGLNSIVSSMENLQVYIKDNNLKGTEDLSHLQIAYKLENKNIKGFLKN